MVSLKEEEVALFPKNESRVEMKWENDCHHSDKQTGLVFFLWKLWIEVTTCMSFNKTITL